LDLRHTADVLVVAQSASVAGGSGEVSSIPGKEHDRVAGSQTAPLAEDEIPAASATDGTVALPGARRRVTSDSEQADDVGVALFHDHRDNERLIDDLPDQASVYRALAFDAVQEASEAQSEDKKEDSSTEALDFLMLQYDRLP
jgi:hypothetical protein